jgi:hypothetical protein
MEELNNGPWATFNEGPITNYIHQVILRDAFTNNKLKKLDIVPEYYRLSEKTADMYWKTNWTGPVDIKRFEYAITDPMRRPKRLL